VLGPELDEPALPVPVLPVPVDGPLADGGGGGGAGACTWGIAGGAAAPELAGFALDGGAG